MNVMKLAEGYVGLWNEPDEKRRREMMETLWAPSGRHFVGSKAIQGFDALEQRVAEAHYKNVDQGGYVFSLDTVYSVHDAILLDWVMRPAGGGGSVAAGRDVLIVDPDMRIVCDYQVIVA